MFLTEEQWQLVKPLLPPSSGRRGRPPRDQRILLNGILWKLSTRSPWRSLPPQFGAYQACYLHYRLWLKNGVLRRIVRTLIDDVTIRGRFDILQAIRGGLVVFERRGRRLQVYLPATLAPSWQLSTAMLYFQHYACLLERKFRLTAPSDPLAALFKRDA